MRTIKFRGKTMDGVWVYGDLINQYSKSTGFGEIRPHISYLEEHSHVVKFEVISETVGQKLSRKDRFGADVYEGDLIEIFWSTTEETIEPISYDERYDYWKYGNNAICELTDPTTEFEVVGNVHDNKNSYAKD